MHNMNIRPSNCSAILLNVIGGHRGHPDIGAIQPSGAVGPIRRPIGINGPAGRGDCVDKKYDLQIFFPLVIV